MILLVFIVLSVREELSWVFNLLGQFLDRFCDSGLKSRLEEEQESNENENVEEKQDQLEI